MTKFWMTKFFIKTLALCICFTMTSGAGATSVDVFSGMRGPMQDPSILVIEEYIEKERYTDAMLELNKLLVSQPDNPDVYNLAARLLTITGEPEEAAKMASEALKLDYKNADAYVALGYAYMEKGSTREEKRENLTKAFDHFFMAAQYDPADPMPHIALAKAYYLNMQLGRATDEILKAQELSYGNPDAWYEIGEYYQMINEYDKAQKYIQKAVKEGRGDSFRAVYNLGTIYEQKGEVKTAQELYLIALELKPDFSEAQERLDGLIKVSYKENQAEKNKPDDLFEDVDPELRTLMKADYHLMLDQYTEARDLYVKLLEKDPQNIAAIAGLAELYYSKWKNGYMTSNNFTSDAIFIIKAETNSKNEIALLKFQMINERKIPEKIRQRLINLSITESFDFYELLNEIRAEFLLGNYEECHNKLARLLEMKLSNYEKFKLLKHLIYDNNYYEAFIVLKELQKTYYHNEEIEPAEKRIKAKFMTAEEKVSQAQLLFEEKDYEAALPLYEEVIDYFPTFKPAYLHYAKALDMLGDYQKAYEKVNTYYRLYNLYPDKQPDVTPDEIKDIIQDLYRKMKQEIKDN